MRTHLYKRLIQYAAAAPACLGLQDAGAQIIVHDPEPNLVGGLNSPVALDFDDDGEPDTDFRISDVHYFGSDSYGNAYHYFWRKILIDPEAGAVVCDWLPEYYYPDRHLPSELGYDAMISSGVSWYRQEYQILCSMGISDWGGIFSANGNWFDKSDTAFLGLKVYLNGAFHYGWVRLNVNYDEPSFTILSYAHHAVPGSYIRAGQTNQYTHTLEAVQMGAQILVSPPEFFVGAPVTLQLHDLSGRTYIHQQMIGEEITYVNMQDLVSGIYVITVNDAYISRSIKVVYIRA